MEKSYLNTISRFWVVIILQFALPTSSISACPLNSERYAQYFVETADRHYPIGAVYSYLFLSQLGDGIAPFNSELQARYLDPQARPGVKPLILLSLFNSKSAEAVKFAREQIPVLLQRFKEPKYANCVEVALTALAIHYIGKKNAHGLVAEIDPLLLKLKNCIAEPTPHFFSALAIVTATHPAHHKEAESVINKEIERSRNYDDLLFEIGLMNLSLLDSRRETDAQYLSQQLRSDSVDVDVFKEKLLKALVRIKGPETHEFKDWYIRIKDGIAKDHKDGIFLSNDKANHETLIEEALELLPYSYCTGELVAKRFKEIAYQDKVRKKAVRFILLSGALSLDEQEKLYAAEKQNFDEKEQRVFERLLTFRKKLKS